MLGFDSALFAIAGLAAAAGPVVIHLFNRRRFRVVPWAAMDFLREALQRRRRVLHLRDLILLLLRMAALFTFGCALARPFLRGRLGLASGLLFAGLCLAAGLSAAAAAVWTEPRRQRPALAACAASILGLSGLFVWVGTHTPSAATRTTSRSPVHAIVVVDNSRSMGTASTAGSRLDRAKSRVEALLDALPADSRISLIALAGTVEPLPADPLRSKDDARRALHRVDVVDQTGALPPGLEAAAAACTAAADLPAKHVVVVSDLQAATWDDFDWQPWFARLPGLQLATVVEEPASNVWIADLNLEEGIAGIEAPSRITARLRADGPQADTTVQAVLSVDGVEVATQAVALTPGQTREVEFLHQFEVAGKPGRPQWSQVTLEVQAESHLADPLPRDNQRTLMVPVMASLPVIFVDQYGDQEDVHSHRIGETYALRHLLAPRLATDAASRRLIQVQHLRIEQLTEAVLETARLVVIAGIEAPQACVPLLREYVMQGGPLVLLAGGSFDPAQWQRDAWLEGQGILPCPVQPTLKGRLPDAASELHPFFVAADSCQHDYFVIRGDDPQVLSGLFGATPFFQSVVCDVSAETLDRWRSVETDRLTDDLRFLQDYREGQRASRLGAASAAMGRLDAENRYRQLEPAWWQWRTPLPLYDRNRTAADLVAAEFPQVLARFNDDRTPWVVQRRIGAGQVLMFASGVTSDWNLLRSSGAMFIFHRALHQLIEGTLPRRNYAMGERAALPLTAWTDQRFVMERPGGSRETIAVEALTAEVSGLLVRRPLIAGAYHITSESAAAAQGTVSLPVSETSAIHFTVQAEETESLPAVLSAAELRARLNRDIPVLDANEPLRVDGGRLGSQGLWRWSIGLALGTLICEMLVLAASNRNARGPQ